MGYSNLHGGIMKKLLAMIMVLGSPGTYLHAQQLPAQQSECHWEQECARYESVCVPGCDPPEENGTVKGCSDCYSREQQCAEWKQVWFCPNS